MGIDDPARGASRRRARAKPRSSTPIRTGWRRRGGATSAPPARSGSCTRRTSRRRSPFGSSRARSRARPIPTSPAPGSSTRIDEHALAEGRIWPQSRASQLVGLAVGARAGERTLDLCAAPGGKATMLAGEVVAVDVNEARAHELEVTARRLGASDVQVVVADGRELPPELDGFDRALVDAPCSGLGVLNRRPDLRWRAEPLPELQLELLRAAAARVRPGGRSSTRCARSTPTSRRPWSMPPGSRSTPRSPRSGRSSGIRGRPEFLQTLPHVHGTAGFFVARMRVTGHESHLGSKSWMTSFSNGRSSSQSVGAERRTQIRSSERPWSRRARSWGRAGTS